MTSELDRRGFITSCAGASLAVAIGAVPAAAKGPAMPSKRNVRKALKYGMIGPGDTVLEKFSLIKELGFDGVEPDAPSELGTDELLSAMDKAGIIIPGVVDSVHWGKPFSHPDPNVRAEGRRGLEQAIRDCKRLRGTSVLVVPAVVNASVSYDAAYERSQEEIRKVLPMAEDLQIRLLMENVWNNFLLSPLEAARYTDEFDSEWVGWHFDIGNIVAYGWPEQWIRILGHRIHKIDAKEYSREKMNREGKGKGFAVNLLEGDCGWPKVMAALDEIGYTAKDEAWMTAEVSGGDADRLRDISERMDRIAAS